MNRIVAALLLVLWTGSVSRCLAEQYGLLHEMPGLECCDHGHEHEEEPGHSHSNPCGICHMIEHSGVSLVRPVVVAEVALLPILEIKLPELSLLPLEATMVPADDWRRPPRRLSWGAYLIKTSLPVRGPDVAC